ncbi:menaquinone biosynthesis protein [Paenibacillus sp. GP183]|uniref:menaquinone biosynthetic enzyme MqnA/MqnD family protein n=1 Tax=Paenibacillus sp. GP183 TaxID=1882751 RepID=UPI00089CB9DB|nr:menaquinone biosynthesis protein [Paenibacillus sp. GP183]SEB64340.1 futalosine synthase [Paenibacillus sp. GP183]
MKSQNNKIRIGRINYTNVWPIYYYFPELVSKEDIEIVNQVPTGLNKALAAGEIDMGTISSFAYGEVFEDYVLYPDLSVSAFGKVNSILLFHEKPLHEIVNGRIALTTSSATSIHLLKIIIEKFYAGKPGYSFASPVLDDMMIKHDAALLIGDDAIRESWRNTKYRITDLGKEWAKWTGEWMSFAVWAVRKDTVDKHPELVKRVFESFVQSKKMGLESPEAMIGEAERTIGGSKEYWRNYFGQLCYDFGSQQWKGLRTYYQYCWELGLLPKMPSIEIWFEKRIARVTE